MTNNVADQPLMTEHRKLMNRKSTLDAAAACVLNDRDASYGAPEDSFAAIAQFWNTYLEQAAPPLESHDIAIMLGLVKIARLAASDGQHEDSWIDLAGYAACGSECVHALPADTTPLSLAIHHLGLPD